MMRIALAPLALLGLSACMMEQVPASQPGGPLVPSEFPVIGSVTGFVAGAPANWETFDYSLGAPDATAFILLTDGQYELIINAFPAGTGGQRADWLQIKSVLPNGPVPGPGNAPVIVLADGDSVNGPRYQSTGAPLLNVSTLSRTDDLYGSISGTFVATLCRVETPDAAPDTGTCLDVAGEFETRLQFDGF
jgi:hypothetical protein